MDVWVCPVRQIDADVDSASNVLIVAADKRAALATKALLIEVLLVAIFKGNVAWDVDLTAGSGR